MMKVGRFALLGAGLLFLVSATAKVEYRWPIPDWMIAPPDAVTASMSNAKVALGRALFYDGRLSANGQLSCGSCHEQGKAFADGERVHAGVHGDPGIRNVPSIANLAYMPVLNWANPNMTRLEAQALVPLFGNAPVEMGMEGRDVELLAALDADPAMMRHLRAAYPAKSRFDLEALTGGLAAFVRSIVSFDSRYDRYKRRWDEAAISEAAKRGEALFFSERMECAHCHGGLNFTDNFQSRMLPFPEVGFHNTGLYNLDGKGAYPAANPGIRELTGDPQDEGKFRAPSLRNVALTAPYMHDGSMATLEAVIRDHYALGGRAASGPHGPSPLRDPLMVGFKVSDQEVADLVAFLEALTDCGLLTNPAYADPKVPAPARAPGCAASQNP